MSKVTVLFKEPVERPVEKIVVTFNLEQFVAFSWLVYKFFDAVKNEELIEGVLDAARIAKVQNRITNTKEVPGLLVPNSSEL